MSRIPYKWLVATAFVLGLFLEILDMTVLNTALPILGEHFRADTAQLQWLITAYLVSLAAGRHDSLLARRTALHAHRVA